MCAPTIRPLVVLALDTGLRQGELLALVWNDVDFERRVVRVRISKSGKPREVGLTARSVGELERLHECRPPIPLHGPDRVFAKIQPNWHGHARMLFAQIGVPLPDIRRLLGHSTLEMVLRYADHVPERPEARAIAMLDERLNLEPKETKNKGRRDAESGRAGAAVG